MTKHSIFAYLNYIIYIYIMTTIIFFILLFCDLKIQVFVEMIYIYQTVSDFTFTDTLIKKKSEAVRFEKGNCCFFGNGKIRFRKETFLFTIGFRLVMK